MKPDSLALISAQVKAALKQTQGVNANTEITVGEKKTQVFSARVVSVVAKSEGDFEIVLKGIDSPNAPSIRVQAKQALPINSEVVLKLEEQSTAKEPATTNKNTDSKANIANTKLPEELKNSLKENNQASPKNSNAAFQAENQGQKIHKKLTLTVLEVTTHSAYKQATSSSNSPVQKTVAAWLASRLPALLENKETLNVHKENLTKLLANINANNKFNLSVAELNSPKNSDNKIQAQAQTAKLVAHYQVANDGKQHSPKAHNHLIQSLNSLLANKSKLPENAQKPLTDWFNSLPQKVEVHAGESLKAQLKNAGIFFESKLSQQLFNLSEPQIKQLKQSILQKAAVSIGTEQVVEKAPKVQINNQQTAKGNVDTSKLQLNTGLSTANSTDNDPLLAQPSIPKAILKPSESISSSLPLEAKSVNKTNTANVPEVLNMPTDKINNARFLPTKTWNLLQTAWHALKLEHPVNAALSNTDKEDKLTLKQILAQTKAKLEQQAEQQIKRSTPSWVRQLQTGDLKVALAQSLIKTLQANMQQGVVARQDVQAAMSGRIPISLNVNSLINETQQLLQQTLAQVEVEQFQQLNDDRPMHNAHLYFRDNQQLQQVNIELLEQDEAVQTEHAQEKTRQWRIRLHFDLQQLGELGVEINLSPPRVAATFWSLQTHALKALQTEIAPLRARLQHQGVDVGELQVRHGRLPESTQNTIQQQLIDVHT